MLTADTLASVAPADAQPPTGGPGMSLLLQSAVAVVVTALGSVSWWSVSPFLADATTGETIGAGAVLVALGAAGKWLADWVVSLRKASSDDEEKREARRTDRERAATEHRDREKAAEIAHLEKALDRETEERRRLQTEQQADRRQHAQEMNDIRAQLMRAEIKLSRAVTWIKSAEHAMRVKKMEHVPWNDEDDEDGSGEIKLHGPEGG